MNAVVTAAAAASILLCICGWILSDRAVKQERYFTPMILIFLCTSFTGGIMVRYLQINDAGNTIGIALMKASASLPAVTFALCGYLKNRNVFRFLLLLAIMLSMMADITINISFIAGGILFAAAHILFDIAFIQRKKPGTVQILLWLILSVPAMIVPYIFRSHLPAAPVMYFAMFYLSVLVSACVFSFPLHKMIFLFAAVFALSDVLLIVNIIIPPSLFMSITALLVYYLSLILYGICIWKAY